MLNLFKSKKSVKETIERIHNEFDTAGDRLLREAKEVLAQECDTEKGERLKKLGFSSSKHAEAADKVKKDKEEKRTLAEAIEHFRMYYPNNKFITVDMVKTICEKYGLLCGPVENYKGDVPTKNIVEMESFTMREEDMEKIVYNWYRYHRDRGHFSYVGKKEDSDCHFGHYQRGQWGMSFCAKEATETHHFHKDSFQICAPKKYFNTEKMDIKGHPLMQIPDPIVLQPVKGGFLIVSKWGLEASDEIVVNQAQN